MKKYKVRLKADTKDEDEENYDMMFRTYIIEENNPAAAALAAGAKFRNTTKTVLDFNGI